MDALNWLCLDIALLMGEDKFEEALALVDAADREWNAGEDTNWLKWHCMATRGMLYSQSRRYELALQAYKDAQRFDPPVYEFAEHQNGIARSLYSLHAGFEEMAHALDEGLSRIDAYPTAALSLLFFYTLIAEENRRMMPLRWVELFRRGCLQLKGECPAFDENDPLAFMQAIRDQPEYECLRAAVHNR